MNRKELTFTHQIRPPHFIAVDEAEEAEARGRHQSHAVLGRVALGEEWLQDVEGESEALYGADTGTDYDTLDPETDKGQERSESCVDVGIVGSRFAYHAAQFSITVGANLKQK